ncbi:MAG: ribose 5-phosphate isomerase B [Alphaproteobacteria bacterium]|nr:ribose 5-phosphate isomerase B [Alphaproteobacteria bacterium]NDC56645.1 ribose 5-phosphate isomerase B [Alphaproteobacteria bacterium]NDG04376.1 ribose 5-phosphate isomerase B [Alphaproteobacteria bacterium]
MAEKILLASDHGGFQLKAHLLAHLTKQGFTCIDLGTDSDTSVDYPDYAQKLARIMQDDADAKGILLCGSGIGISMAANRFAHIRAALCHDVTSAKLSRQHNDANVLCLGGRLVGPTLAVEIVTTFLSTAFEGGRHAARLVKMS